VRYTDTPIGRNPTQIDYADYREVDGVKVPFRWTLARVNGRFTIQIQEATQNVPIDDAKFAKPAAPRNPSLYSLMKSICAFRSDSPAAIWSPNSM
jgi:hypothetical protein